MVGEVDGEGEGFGVGAGLSGVEGEGDGDAKDGSYPIGVNCRISVESGVKILWPPPIAYNVSFMTATLNPALSIGIEAAVLQELVSGEYT